MCLQFPRITALLGGILFFVPLNTDALVSS